MTSVAMIGVIVAPPLLSLVVELTRRNPASGGLISMFALATCVANYRVNGRLQRATKTPDTTPELH